MPAERSELLDALHKSHEQHIAAYGTAESTAVRFQLFRLVLLVLLAGLIYSHDFAAQPFESIVRDYEQWRDAHAQEAWLFEVTPRRLRRESEKARQAVMDQYFTTAELNQTMDKPMSRVYAWIVETKLQGDDVTQIDRIRKLLTSKKVEYSTDTRAVLQGRRVTKDNLIGLFLPPAFGGQTQSTSTALAEIRSQIADIKQVSDLFESTFKGEVQFETFATQGLQTLDSIAASRAHDMTLWNAVHSAAPDWREWQWEAFRKLSDKHVSEWTSVMGKLGKWRTSAIGRVDAKKPLSESLQSLEELIDSERRLLASSSERLTLLSVPVVVPKVPLLILFPLLFCASLGVERALWLRRQLTMFRVASVKSHLDEIVGADCGPSLVGKEILNDRTVLSYAVRGQLGKLFEDYPTVFTDLLFQLATWTIASYLFWKWAE